jgi:hypothetical protein
MPWFHNSNLVQNISTCFLLPWSIMHFIMGNYIMNYYQNSKYLLRKLIFIFYKIKFLLLIF